MRGFLLGLSNGTICLAYCAPAIVPFLLGEGQNTKRVSIYVAEFLSGRLIGYILFAIAAWGLGWIVVDRIQDREIIFGFAYVILGLMMFYYGIGKKEKSCTAKKAGNLIKFKNPIITRLMPLILGFLTGINLCPPFLSVFTEAAATNSIVESLLFFITFFIGTAIYFIPFCLFGLSSKSESIKFVGRVVSVCMALFYLYSGVIKIYGGIVL